MRKADPKRDLYHMPLMARIELKLAFKEVKYLLSVKTLDPQDQSYPCEVKLEWNYQ